MTTPTKATPAPKTTNPAATKPVAAKPTATKPVAAKPAATKPTATKPVAAKPVATKPAAAKKAPAPKVQPVVEPIEAAIISNTEMASKMSAETFKSYEDIIALSKENIEALVQSNDIYNKGVQQISEAFFKLVQDNVAQTVDYTKKIMTSTSIEDVVALQQELATTQYSKTVEESQLLSDMTVKLAEKASKPISDRVNVTIETLTKPIAA